MKITSGRARRVAVLTTLLTALAAPAAHAAAPPTILSDGHVDAVAPAIVDGQLVVKVKDETQGQPAVVRDPADVVFQVLPAARQTVPASVTPGSPFSFLGAPGDAFWLIPQVQQPGVVWAGWSSESITPAQVGDSTLRWKLLGVEGPGAVQLYTIGAFSTPTIVFNSADGLPDEDLRPIGAHAHFNWAFHGTGLYTLTFEVSAKAPSGATISSGPVQYRFFVGDPVELPAADVQLSVGGLRGHYHPGDTVTLRAVQEPQTELDHYHWFARCGTAADFAEVGAGDTYSFTAAATHDGCQVKVTLYDETHTPLVTSDPVTVHVESHDEPGGEATAGGTVSGTVPGTLALALDGDGTASFGAFALGAERDYVASIGATASSSGEQNRLTIEDASASHPGHLVNGAYALAQPLQAQAAPGEYGDVGAAPLTLATFGQPLNAARVTLNLRQHIRGDEVLRTGAYGKTLKFTLATATP